MQGEVYHSDNSGNKIAIPGTMDPVAASGITKSISGTNATVTVEAGARYSVVAGKATAFGYEIMSLSITGTAVTDANKEWNIPLGKLVIIKIPEGVTTLNVVSTLASATLFMSKLK